MKLNPTRDATAVVTGMARTCMHITRAQSATRAAHPHQRWRPTMYSTHLGLELEVADEEHERVELGLRRVPVALVHGRRPAQCNAM
jgi:hypothetical protein